MLSVGGQLLFLFAVGYLQSMVASEERGQIVIDMIELFLQEKNLLSKEETIVGGNPSRSFGKRSKILF